MSSSTSLKKMDDLYSPSNYACEEPNKLFGDFIAAQVAAHEDLKNRFPFEELTYGPGENQKIDVFGNVGSKLVILVHGGYWQFGNRAAIATAALPFVERGYTVASTGYSFATAERPLSKTISDVILSVKTLLEKYETVKEVTLAGHSAGAHLAFHVASKLQDARIKNLILIAGVYDSTELVGTETGNGIGLTIEEAAKTKCNVHDLPKNLRVLILGAGKEAPKLKEQNEKIGKELASVLDAEYREFPELNHFNLVTKLGNDNEEPTKKVQKFLKI